MGTFEKWLEAQGFAAGDLTNHQRGVLRALYRRRRDLGGEIPNLQSAIQNPKSDIEAPYPNEHAARLREPGDFDPKTFRRTTDGTLYGRIAVPKDVSVIWAKLKGHSGAKDMPQAQSLRFPKAKWTAAKARKWLDDHNIHYVRFEAATGGKGRPTAQKRGGDPQKTKGGETAGDITAAAWTTKYVNDLPDSAFLYIESGGKKDAGGKTAPRSLRHFPYRDASGKIDMPHLRNAISRIPQSNAKGLTPAKKDALQKKARKLLDAENAKQKKQAAGAVDPPRQAGVAAAAAQPGEIEIITSPGALSITAAAEDEGDGEGNSNGLPRFEMTAYTGVAMDLMGWLWPVVIDLEGVGVSKRSRPVLLNHDRNEIVGHTERIDVDGEKIEVAGVVSGTADAAKQVVSTSKNDFPWRASVGMDVAEMSFIEAGKSEEANGQEHHGPIYIARKSALGEISFVTLAADDETEAKIAARRAEATSTGTGGITMFEQWLKDNGFEADKISEQQRATLEAAWKLTQPPGDDPPAVGEGDPASPPAATRGESASPPAGDGVKTEEEVTAAAVTAERQRVKRIEAACKDLPGEPVVQLKAKAMGGEVDLDTLQAKLLDILRDDRPKGFAIGAGRSEADEKVLLACAYRAGGVTEKSILDEVGEAALEAADKLRGMGIQELAARAAMLEGVELPRFQSDSQAWLTAAFSTMSLPGLLSTTANKLLLEGYNYVEDAWRKVCNIASVKDFKQHTRYRLTGDMKFVEVASTGELAHATVDEQSFTQQADTYGILFSLTRRDIVNDDLSAFTAIPRMLGMGAGEAIAEAVWTLLLSNPSSFFAAGHGNTATGGSSALSIDGLTAGELLFLDQTKPNGRPLGVPPKVLCVPTALKVTAEQLMSSLKLTESNTTASTKTKAPTDNPHAGKFEIACSAYLSNAALSGYSATGWYLLADPRVLAAIEVAFLNGIDRPTVEKAEANFNTLGVRFRGYVDFGVAMQDYRAAVLMAGA